MHDAKRIICHTCFIYYLKIDHWLIFKEEMKAMSNMLPISYFKIDQGAIFKRDVDARKKQRRLNNEESDFVYTKIAGRPGSDFLYTKIAAPPGSDFLYTKIAGRPGSDFICTKMLNKNNEEVMIYFQNFPRCARQSLKNFLRKSNVILKNFRAARAYL